MRKRTPAGTEMFLQGFLAEKRELCAGMPFAFDKINE